MSELAGLVVFFAAAFVWAALRRDPPRPLPPPTHPDAVTHARPLRTPT